MNVKKSPISASMVQLLVWKTRSLGLRHMIPIVIGMQPHWRMMGALETAGGLLLFGIRTAYILAVIRRTSRCARPTVNERDGDEPPQRIRIIRFWLWKRSATAASPDRSGHLSTDVVTSSLKRTDDLRSNPSREAREFFNLVSSIPGIWRGERRSESVDALGQEPFS
jgi:hypothetical protein